MRCLYLYIIILYHLPGWAQINPPGKLKIFINQSLVKVTDSVNEPFDNLGRATGRLVADSIVFKNNQYFIYYRTAVRIDSIVLLSNRSIPRNVNRFYQKHFSSDLKKLKTALRNDFIDILETRPIILNGKEVLYVKTDYHPPGQVSADLYMDHTNNRIRIYGSARLELNNTFAGNDKINLHYRATKNISSARFSYLMKYLAGLPFSLENGMEQNRTDSINETKFHSIAVIHGRRFNWLIGFEGVKIRFQTTNFFLLGSEFRSANKKNKLHTKLMASLRPKSIGTFRLNGLWQYYGKCLVKNRLLVDFTKSPSPAYFVRYNDLFTAPLIGPGLYAFSDFKNTVVLEKKFTDIYVANRFLLFFSENQSKNWGIVSSTGIKIKHEKSIFGFEIAYPFGKGYPSGFKRITFLIKQQFIW